MTPAGIAWFVDVRCEHEAITVFVPHGERRQPTSSQVDAAIKSEFSERQPGCSCQSELLRDGWDGWLTVTEGAA